MSSPNRSSIVFDSMCEEDPSETAESGRNSSCSRNIKQQTGFLDSSWSVGSVATAAADLVALLVAFELQGLLDAVNADEFVARGGWFQPLPAIQDSTLLLLVQRLSLNSVLWLLVLSSFWAAESRNNVSHSTPLTTSETAKSELRQLPAFVGLFAVFRCLVLLAGIVLADSPKLDVILLYDAARDIYFVGLSMLAIRLLR